ncbi:S-layer homology domain-containing protein [Ructibacterium gallinarum]|uniref:S-layer homology domain-containing protein n=1 Tax=Ructibacterium gallinarum TaxID=2779355 RepID=A0A9D5R7W8_9FIRM|nr:S-layer homology domain-containing protein [Ructibacterium gallinarum]MBE5039327.1 S-layer homology domain-containing protein [Ructibacterium gallinarum]
MVKKWLIVVLTVCMMLSSMVYVYAAESEMDSLARQRVCDLGIMEGDEDGNMHFDDFITRAEFVTIALRLKLYGNVELYQEETRFLDVPSSHWASGLISMAEGMGIITGDVEGTFRPDAFVTYDEAVKILVCVAGYDVAANELGGYPNGYYAEANRLGIVKDVERIEGNVTRGLVCNMIYNTLDIIPLEKSVGRDEYIKNTENKTLYELYSEAQELQEIKGVLLETEWVSAIADEISVAENQVFIGDTVYYCNKDYSDLLGYVVQGWIRYNDETGRNEIAEIHIAENNNIWWEAEADMVTLKADYIGVYQDPAYNTLKKYYFDDGFTYVYNGRLAEKPKQIYNGCYRGIDNNKNGKIDVLIVEETESFIVSRVSEDAEMLYLEGKQTYKGKNGIRVNRDDPEYICNIVDLEGNPMEYTKMKPGCAITVMASENDQYTKIIVSEKTVTGEIESVYEEEVAIDGVKYSLLKMADGTFSIYQYIDSGSALLGTSGTFAIDTNDKLVGLCSLTEQSGEIYGYVVQAAVEGSFSNTLKIRLLQGMEPEKEVKMESGNEKIYYNFQNDLLKEYVCTDQVKMNGAHFDQQNIHEIAGKVVKLKLNSNNQVKEIETYAVPSVMDKCDFNGKILSFGGEGLQRGYATDQNTMFICLPKFCDEEDDYYVRVQLADESTANEVYGVNMYHDMYSSSLPVDEIQRRQEAEPVEVLLISAYMDASQSTIVPDTADICIVGGISSSLGTARGDEGCLVYTLELLNEKEKVSVTTKSAGDVYEKVKNKLRQGDLIRYTTDVYGRIEQLDILASVQGLSSYGEKEKGYYGIIRDLQQNFYDFQVNQMIDEITVYFDEYQQQQIARVMKEDGQPVYMYDRQRGTISSASTDDIVTMNQTSQEEATKIFVLVEDNDAQAVVLIED